MLLLNAIQVIIYTIFGAVICMVLVTSAVYFVRQGGYLTWIPIALWFGCPAWGLWQGNDPVERMMWMGAGCMLGCGILLEVAPPEWWWRRNDDGPIKIRAVSRGRPPRKPVAEGLRPAAR